MIDVARRTGVDEVPLVVWRVRHQVRRPDRQPAAGVSHRQRAPRWGTRAYVGCAVTTEGISFGTTDSTMSTSKKWARFGVSVRNTSGTDLEACLASLQVDLRYGG